MATIPGEELRARTAQLIADCPDWCDVEHDVASHPEDIYHLMAVGDSPDGPIAIEVWPLPMGDAPRMSIYLPDHDGVNLGRDEAIAFAAGLVNAAAALREVAA